MKTHEEIKKLLAHHKGCIYDADALMADALALIQHLEAQLPRWISIDERLPEYGDVVLVIANGKPRKNITLHNAILIASHWADEGWIADGFEGWDGLHVTHWQPLPELPKEG